MTSICVISDTHNCHELFNIPKVDILIHCGDFTNMGTVPEFNKFSKWLNKVDAKHKIIIYGNHDFLGERIPILAKQLLTHNNVHVLDNQFLTIENINFYGTSWQPQFHNWAFNKSLEDRERHWNNIVSRNKKIDVLITHCPPYGIRDLIDDGHLRIENVGCAALKKAAEIIKPKYHVFGHIHENFGISDIDRTKYINASMLDNTLRKVADREPIILEI